MNFRLASSLLLLATAATSTTAETTKSKASRYRIFPVRHRPKAGKATVGSTPVSTAVAKTSKALLPPLSVSMSVPSKAAKSKFAKVVKSKAVKCWKDDEQSVSMSMSMPTRALNVVGRFLDHSVSMSLSVSSKAAKSKVSKCLPEMSLSMSIPTMTPTTPFPSYYPTIAPTLAPVRRQRMECRSGDFVDALGRDCFWYEEPNVKYGCESLLQAGSPDQDLANTEGKTPWDECCFCGGGVMVPEDQVTPAASASSTAIDPSPVGRRKLRDVAAEANDVEEEQKMEAVSVSCESNPHFVDPLGRDCFYYVPQNIEQGCDSLHGKGDMVNEYPWTNDEGLTPFSECCWCGGGTLGYESVPVAPMV